MSEPQIVSEVSEPEFMTRLGLDARCSEDQALYQDMKVRNTLLCSSLIDEPLIGRSTAGI